MSLGNVLAVAYATQREKLTFLEEDDKVGTGSPRVWVGPGLTSADTGRQRGPGQGEERAGPTTSQPGGPVTWPVCSPVKQWRQFLPPGLLQG